MKAEHGIDQHDLSQWQLRIYHARLFGRYSSDLLMIILTGNMIICRITLGEKTLNVDHC